MKRLIFRPIPEEGDEGPVLKREDEGLEDDEEGPPGDWEPARGIAWQQRLDGRQEYLRGLERPGVVERESTRELREEEGARGHRIGGRQKEADGSALGLSEEDPSLEEPGSRFEGIGF